MKDHSHPAVIALAANKRQTTEYFTKLSHRKVSFFRLWFWKDSDCS